MLSVPAVAVAELAPIDVVGRLLLAALLGGLLGVERELDGQDAGFRTHLLLALGAGLFGALSVGAFSSLVADPSETNVQIDVTRVASYVAAGIGFIGGGTILKHRGSVTGITTAASLWTAAATGLAAGLGFWVGAVATCVIAIGALRGLKPLSNWLARHGTASLHHDGGEHADSDPDA
jgi:putative Mg2+ transporter-C (MgtC) family protein